MDMLNMPFGNDRFKQAMELAAEKNVVIADVRTPDEFKEGHIPGSVNMPVERLAAMDIDEDKHYLVYCLSGARSQRATLWLKENGIDAENIGGILDYNGELEK